MNTDAKKPWVISSEASAWKVLERLVDDGVKLDSIEFDGWPEVSLKISGDRYSASMPSGLMQHVSAIQAVINRSYGRAAYQGDGRSISPSERDELELVYEISEGSTEIKADATGLLNRLGDAMMKPSTATNAGVTLVVLALIVSGSVVISSLSSNRREVEIKRIELLQRAIEKAPEMKNSTPEFQRVYRDIISSVSDADKVIVGSKTIATNQISEISKTSKGTGQRVDMSGQYRVSSIRRFSKHCLIDVLLPDGSVVRARVVFEKFPSAAIESVSTSVAKNTPIGLSFTAIKHQDGYSNGRVTSIGGDAKPELIAKR